MRLRLPAARVRARGERGRAHAAKGSDRLGRDGARAAGGAALAALHLPERAGARTGTDAADARGDRVLAVLLPDRRAARRRAAGRTARPRGGTRAPGAQVDRLGAG